MTLQISEVLIKKKQIKTIHISVEGEDDARTINLLLKQKTPPSKKKYMFWVLGGISSALDSINSYKTVFSEIKNKKTLWEKSTFIFDKDDLSIEHKNLLCNKFHTKLDLKAYSWNSYTFESTLLTELDKFAELLALWVNSKTNKSENTEQIRNKVHLEYQKFKSILELRFTDYYFENAYHRYKNIIIGKSEKVFDEKLLKLTKTIKNLSDPQLMTYIRQNNRTIIETGQYYQLMKKDDVELLINNVLNDFALSFSIETNFIELIKLVNQSFWFTEWDFLIDM